MHRQSSSARCIIRSLLHRAKLLLMRAAAGIGQPLDMSSDCHRLALAPGSTRRTPVIAPRPNRRAARRRDMHRAAAPAAIPGFPFEGIRSVTDVPNRRAFYGAVGLARPCRTTVLTISVRPLAVGPVSSVRSVVDTYCFQLHTTGPGYVCAYLGKSIRT
jgi:hypothetical protein